MRTCRFCLEEKEPSEFYVSNKTVCKECVRENVRANRRKKIDYYRSYDRSRYRENDDRKKAAARCANSPIGKQLRRESMLRTRENEPEKYRARNLVASAIKRGKLVRADNCYFCSESGKLHAHHYDYTRPLDVFWLCPKCHGKLHVINGDFLKKTRTGT